MSHNECSTEYEKEIHTTSLDFIEEISDSFDTEYERTRSYLELNGFPSTECRQMALFNEMLQLKDLLCGIAIDEICLREKIEQTLIGNRGSIQNSSKEQE